MTAGMASMQAPAPLYSKLRPLIVVVLVVCVSIVITAAVFRALTAMRSDYDSDPLVKGAQTEQVQENSRILRALSGLAFIIAIVCCAVFGCAYAYFQVTPPVITTPPPVITTSTPVITTTTTCTAKVFLHDQTGKERILQDFEWDCDAHKILKNASVEPDGLRDAIALPLNSSQFSIHSACRILDSNVEAGQQSSELKYYVQVETDCDPKKYSPDLNKECSQIMIDVKISRINTYSEKVPSKSCSSVEGSLGSTHSIIFPGKNRRSFNCGPSKRKAKLALYRTVLDERLEHFKTGKSKTFPEAFVLTSGRSCELKELPLLVDDIAPKNRDLVMYKDAQIHLTTLYNGDVNSSI